MKLQSKLIKDQGVLVALVLICTICFAQYQSYLTVNNRVALKQTQLHSAIKNYAATIQKRFNPQLVKQEIETHLATTAIELQSESLLYKFVVQSHNSGQLLLDIIETLKLFYGPINELNLDFLNQTVELTFPKR